MIKLRFTEPQTPEWQAWRQEAEREIQMLQASSPPYAIRDSLYKQQRETLFACYRNKCAYCEANYRLTNRDADVEHFRPKGRVRDKHSKIVKVQRNGHEVNHPGYWWLAYEPWNLMPSCPFCNRTAKRELFPLEDGCDYAMQPGEELLEKPLLLHPVVDDPDQHLQFRQRFGVLVPLSDRGQATIDTFLLNRELLCEERRDVYATVYSLLTTLKSFVARMANLSDDEKDAMERIRRMVARHKRGEAAYSIAGRAAIRNYLGEA
jgi:hypothetical protein